MNLHHTTPYYTTPHHTTQHHTTPHYTTPHHTTPHHTTLHHTTPHHTGLLKLQYTAEAVPPEVVVKSYAVRAVVDRAAKKTITFHEAVAKGIIDKETGAFKDTVTNEIMYVGDAIMRGFLKARQMADVSGMNIDPSNKMIVEKTQKIRSKLLNPLKVISAFKGALKRPGSAGAK